MGGEDKGKGGTIRRGLEVRGWGWAGVSILPVDSLENAPKEDQPDC